MKFPPRLPARLLVAMLGFCFLISPFAVCGQGTQLNYDPSGSLLRTAPLSGTAPVVSGPQNALSAVGGVAALTVLANGSPPLSYRWYFNSNLMAGATSDSLVFTNVAATNFGAYHVVVTNTSGSVTSTVARLYLDADKDGLADSWEITYFGSIAAKNAVQDSDSDGVSNLDEFRDGTNPTNSASLFPRLFTSVVGPGTLTGTPNLIKYSLGQIVTLTATPAVGNVFFNWDGGLIGSSNPATLVMNASKTVTAYFVRPSNDDFTNRISFNTDSFTDERSNGGGTKEAGEPNHAGNPGGRSVWWTWTAPDDGNVTIYTLGSSFDTLLAVYTGASVASLTEIASNDNGLFDQTSQVSFSAVGGTTYQIAVDGKSGTSGDIKLDLSWSSSSTPPMAFAFGSPITGNAPLTVTFYDFSFGDITNRFWNFGNGNTTNTTATSLTQTYGPGTYTVTLIVRGPGGVSTNVQPDYITAAPSSQPQFTGLSISGGKIHMTLLGEVGLTYHVQRSGKLTNWADWTNVFMNTSQVSISDPLLLGATNRFYRAVLP